MSDELFELRNYFYLGNIAAAQTEGETVSIDDEKSRIERDVILKRLDLARGKYDVVISTIGDDSPPAMQVVKMIAQFISEPASKDQIIASLKSLGDDEVSASSPCFLLMCSILYAHLGDYDNALRTANRVKSLEEMAVKVQVLLRIDRVDIADKEVAAMQAIDEDATITQLATAWTHLAKGGESVQEAFYIYQDLLERHGATDQILNGMAVCHLAAGKSEESERVLTEALTKNPNCATTLINVICNSKYKNKPTALVDRYFAQLEQVDPSNAWLRDYRQKEAEFDDLAQKIVSV